MDLLLCVALFPMIRLPLSDVPKHLFERTRTFQEPAFTTSSGEYVIYWMRTAVRSHENPAFEVAATLADQLGLPLLVYHGLSSRYRYASDRHHTFILEGARDVQASFRQSAISYAFHLEKTDEKSDALRRLASSAAAVVTEDMPTAPAAIFLRALAAKTDTPIIAVDTACVVPMQLVGKAHTRAFAYRDATRTLYRERLTSPWPTVSLRLEPFDFERLPFVPIDLATASLPDCVGQCDVDHTVGPVLDTQGGSTAGYERWNAFKQTKLERYAAARNEPLLDGVSRMSAYLHYGMVSPMRLAREAALEAGAGSGKFLDELLIWRELAYSYCFYRPDHDRWLTLPAWSRRSLELHIVDQRPRIYSWEEATRGATDDELWNAAQRSLLIHGELHNNLRMTWGKAMLQWTRTPKEAFGLMKDLNHRYALDGRDPASYGGLLWCLGEFDRPFESEVPILGTVRPRPTSEHAKRLDVRAYADKIGRSRSARAPAVAVVGAGIAGAMAARTLADHGLTVVVFEKSRGLGGRTATRRQSDAEFDHGSQYFTARSPDFRRYVDAWQEQGVVAKWEAPIVAYRNTLSGWEASDTRAIDRYVGTPTMTSVAKHLLQRADVRTEQRVVSVRHEAGGYVLFNDESGPLGSFDRIVLAVPAGQAAELLDDSSAMKSRLTSIVHDPCWCVMIGTEERSPLTWGGAFVHDGPIRWAARNQTKPQRLDRGERIVLHASAEWSRAHMEASADSVCQELSEAFWRMSAWRPTSSATMTAHRWRYSIPQQKSSRRCWSDADATLIVCGDWAGGPRVEGAFLSGCAAAGQLLRTLPAAC